MPQLDYYAATVKNFLCEKGAAKKEMNNGEGNG
jgi:hypothetical protein